MLYNQKATAVFWAFDCPCNHFLSRSGRGSHDQVPHRAGDDCLSPSFQAPGTRCPASRQGLRPVIPVVGCLVVGTASPSAFTAYLQVEHADTDYI
jgi:hypothetical protein